MLSGFTIGWDVARWLVDLGEATRAPGDAKTARDIFRDALHEAIAAQAGASAGSFQALVQGLLRDEGEKNPPHHTLEVAG